MRQTIRTATLGLATAAVLASAVPGPASAEETDAATTTHETGHVVECVATWAQRTAFVTLYDNDQYGNTLLVQLRTTGVDRMRVGQRSPDDDLVASDGAVATGVLVGGHRARVRGTAPERGKPVHVHEEYADAGYDIVVDGTHRRLDADLVLRFRDRRHPLDCSTAFTYDLDVTRTPAQ
ncbi:hypothetical protein [Nocardioides sp. GY 10127]|uniref:hypothetical protein n=1 Tax=Nocardioides sp. GY 10127 TaxID=2569762 RepID=UPI0010A81CE1|nr:hypothetical protein [Nocardioides sp. GY 10127]TIC86435.1 hypothetical protein E8D37_00550 [Nocardioides sp. GY 10127]